MRKAALVTDADSELKRLMIHKTDEGVYLFGYNTAEDAGCFWDEWYESVAEAEAASEEYGVTPAAWQAIPDPLEGCQQDWIAPVRVKGRLEGRPLWGNFEKLVDGQWIPFTPPV